MKPNELGLPLSWGCWWRQGSLGPALTLQGWGEQQQMGKSPVPAWHRSGGGNSCTRQGSHSTAEPSHPNQSLLGASALLELAFHLEQEQCHGNRWEGTAMQSYVWASTACWRQDPQPALSNTETQNLPVMEQKQPPAMSHLCSVTPALRLSHTEALLMKGTQCLPLVPTVKIFH